MKQALLDHFSAWLDTAEPAATAETDETADLYSIFVELAGMRSELRTESRLVKDALDQFRAVFETLQASQDTLRHELERARADSANATRAALRPLLLDVVDLRDRLLAAVKLAATPARPSLVDSLVDSLLRRRPPDGTAWQDGLRMTLRRLDQVLADRQVVPLVLQGRPFDPHRARAVGTAPGAGVAEGIVLEEIRTGFLWEDQVLRIADVIVSKRPTGVGEKS
jgi:molecular chaperone GrpE